MVFAGSSFTTKCGKIHKFLFSSFRFGWTCARALVHFHVERTTTSVSIFRRHPNIFTNQKLFAKLNCWSVYTQKGRQSGDSVQRTRGSGKTLLPNDDGLLKPEEFLRQKVESAKRLHNSRGRGVIINWRKTLPFERGELIFKQRNFFFTLSSLNLLARAPAVSVSALIIKSIPSIFAHKTYRNGTSRI